MREGWETEDDLHYTPSKKYNPQSYCAYWKNGGWIMEVLFNEGVWGIRFQGDKPMMFSPTAATSIDEVKALAELLYMSRL